VYARWTGLNESEICYSFSLHSFRNIGDSLTFITRIIVFLHFPFSKTAATPSPLLRKLGSDSVIASDCFISGSCTGIIASQWALILTRLSVLTTRVSSKFVTKGNTMAPRNNEMVLESKLITALVLDKNSDPRMASCERFLTMRNLILVISVPRSNERLAIPIISRNELLAETYNWLSVCGSIFTLWRKCLLKYFSEMHEQLAPVSHSKRRKCPFSLPLT